MRRRFARFRIINKTKKNLVPSIEHIVSSASGVAPIVIQIFAVTPLPSNWISLRHSLCLALLRRFQRAAIWHCLVWWEIICSEWVRAKAYQIESQSFDCRHSLTFYFRRKLSEHSEMERMFCDMTNWMLACAVPLHHDALTLYLNSLFLLPQLPTKEIEWIRCRTSKSTKRRKCKCNSRSECCRQFCVKEQYCATRANVIVLSVPGIRFSI